MTTTDHPTKIKNIPVSEINIGTRIVNLGTLLEREESSGYYNLIIDRLNEKQVIKFESNAILIVEC